MKTLKEFNEKHKPYRVVKIANGCFHLYHSGETEKPVAKYDAGRFQYAEIIDREHKAAFERVIVARLKGW